ncbi:MAG TPA: hypothetical protein VGN32_09405 [Ktedonobacterales bacterium]|nr:hypothetical protein [Ktedonobacterales bacterium]
MQEAYPRRLAITHRISHARIADRCRIAGAYISLRQQQARAGLVVTVLGPWNRLRGQRMGYLSRAVRAATD